MLKIGKHFPLKGLLTLVFAALGLSVACGGGGPEELVIPVTLRGETMTPETIQVGHNDTVTLQIDSDAPGALHLHGYDLEGEVRAGEVTDFVFVADATGRFRVAFHEATVEAESPQGPGVSEEGGGSHGHGKADNRDVDAVEAGAPVAVAISVTAGTQGEADVQIKTDNWRWAPEAVDQDHEPGVGHAHIYVDGVQISRVFGPEFHMEDLEPGMREIRVALNSNNHKELMVDGEVVEATAKVTIPESAEGSHEHGGSDGSMDDHAAGQEGSEIDVGFLEVRPR